MLMQQAPKKPQMDQQTLPPLMEAGQTRSLLEEHIYGPIPTLSDVTILEKRLVTKNAFSDNDRVTEWKVSAGYGDGTRLFHIVFISRPSGRDVKTGTTPYIITQNFCPNTSVVPIDGITPPQGDYFDCSGDGIMGRVFGYFFGRYITVPPYEIILDRGYNIAVMYPSEFSPDSRSAAPRVINALFPGAQEKPGALAIWSSLTTWLAEELKNTETSQQIIAYGHSRYGKTALLSGASSDNIEAIIAHQSGTGGASILRDGTGESIESIIESYPHWFNSKFVEYSENVDALPVDAHNLLSLIADKPLMLGNARRDVWSDPEGAFHAARLASRAWQSGPGQIAFTANRLDEFIPSDDIAFWMRPGTHGVVKEDWPAFLDFIDAHFKD